MPSIAVGYATNNGTIRRAAQTVCELAHIRCRLLKSQRLQTMPVKTNDLLRQHQHPRRVLDPDLDEVKNCGPLYGV